ncbi:hypothetical protein [Sphingomonas bacterium]|nr:hypothetical protein [Sphingomonas bacterium]
MDVMLFGLVEDVIKVVDERHGWVAAWITAVFGTLLLIAVALGLILYALR